MATSTTRPKQKGKVTTRVTFPVAGDPLVPEQVTCNLKFVPGRAYAKGERYYGGPRSLNLWTTWRLVPFDTGYRRQR